MNEQNNVNSNPQPLSEGQVPVQPVNPQPATVAQPTQSPAPVQNAQVVQTPVQSAPVESNPTPSPAPTPVVQQSPEVQPVNPQPVVTEAPVSSPEQPVVVNQPVQETVQTSVPVQNVQPVQEPVQSTPVAPPQAPVQSQQPVQQPIQDSTPAQPINPVPNASSVPNNGVFGPSVPLTGVNNVTDIGFVAASTDMPKKKNKGLIIGIVVAVVIILAAIGYFVVYPFIMKTYFSDPKNVYETSIKNAFKGISTTANDLVHNKAIYDIELTFDSNIESLKDYTGYTYGLNVGIDPVKKKIQEGFRIKKLTDDVAHSYNYYVKDNKIYENYSTSANRGYIYRGEVDPEEANDLFSLFSNEDMYNSANKLNNEDVNYLVDKISQLLVDSIDEDKLSKDDSSITLDGKTIKVTDNKYVVDYETTQKTVDFVIDGLIKDDKVMEILNKTIDAEDINAKDLLEEFRLEDNDSKDTLTISIYTYGNKNEIVGFGLKGSDDKLDAHYYFNNDYKELKIHSKAENPDTGKIEEDSLEAIAKKEGSKTKVTFKSNDKEFLTLDVKQWDEKGIDFDYNLIVEGDNISGTFKFTKDVNNERAKISLEATVKMGTEYVSVALDFSEDWTAEVANINTDTAIQMDDAEIEKIQEDFIKVLVDSPIGKVLTSVSGDYNSSIKDYYNSDNNNNYYNAIENPSDNDLDLDEKKNLTDTM